MYLRGEARGEAKKKKNLKSALTVTSLWGHSHFSICSSFSDFLEIFFCLFTEGAGSLEALRDYMDINPEE